MYFRGLSARVIGAVGDLFVWLFVWLMGWVLAMVVIWLVGWGSFVG